MRVFDYSFASPAENLALDEILLESAESDETGECLRFWESTTEFVVLGLTQSAREHVITEACEADGVSILRRCTAGGCVLQAPGCLNYAFVLRMDREGCDTIHGSYRIILGWLREALASFGLDAHHAGISDLAVDHRKVSGNAQKRKRRFLLHHGTLLYAFDPRRCDRYLRQPADRPEYRGDRRHIEFMRNLTATREELVEAVSGLFRDSSLQQIRASEQHRATALATEKYLRNEWIYRH